MAIMGTAVICSVYMYGTQAHHYRHSHEQNMLCTLHVTQTTTCIVHAMTDLSSISAESISSQPVRPSPPWELSGKLIPTYLGH